MVIQFVVQNSKYSFQEKDEKQKAKVGTAAALLASTIADADVITDWVYFAEIFSRGEVDVKIPLWIRIFQLVSCILGSLSWLAISSDGRFVDWIRVIVWWMVWLFFKLVRTIFVTIPASVVGCICCIESNINERPIDRVIEKINTFFSDGFNLSSGGLLMVGIVVEDLPQIIVTFLVEEAIDPDRTDGISTSAYLNLILAIFDILHKLAMAWDDRKLYINTGTGVQTLHGHKSEVCSLAYVESNRIVSASRDGTAKLWDTKTGKNIQTFDLSTEDWARTSGIVAKLGKERIIYFKTDDVGGMIVFDIQSGKCLKRIGHTCHVAAVSERGDYFLTSKRNVFSDKAITRWDATTMEPIKTYPEEAAHLVILGNDRFVSAVEGRHPVLWNAGTEGGPVQNYNITGRDNGVNAMCMRNSDSFLVASRNGLDGFVYSISIDLFSADGPEPIKTMTMKGFQVEFLVSTGDERFITCQGGSACSLWDFSSETCLHTFTGHSKEINSIVYLPEETAIATASNDCSVKVWPLPTDNDQQSDKLAIEENDSIEHA